jgi:hypothetical protein
VAVEDLLPGVFPRGDIEVSVDGAIHLLKVDRRLGSEDSVKEQTRLQRREGVEGLYVFHGFS